MVTSDDLNRAEASNARACVNCGHDDHYGKPCAGRADEGANWCACSWPDPSNYVYAPIDDRGQLVAVTPITYEDIQAGDYVSTSQGTVYKLTSVAKRVAWKDCRAVMVASAFLPDAIGTELSCTINARMATFAYWRPNQGET